MSRWRTAGRPVDYDVVIVGARCAGAATAMLLARCGLSVLAVDKARYGTDTLSTHALTRPSVRQLSRWRVLDDVRRAGTPLASRVVYHYADDIIDVPVPPRGDVDGLYAPRRHVLDRILSDAAVRAGAEVRHQVTVRDLCFENGRVVGVLVDDGRTRARLRAGIVIGADGARSGTARRVGAEALYAAPHTSATIYTFVDGLPDDAFRNYFRPGVSAGVIPTNAGQANVWVGVPVDRFWREGRGDIAGFYGDMLSAAAPDLALEVADRMTGRHFPTFAGLRGFARRCWGPGWALVGDAGYFKDPISAHGMTDALIGAEILSHAVVAIADGDRESAALARYDVARQRLIAPMIPAIEHAASFSWDTASLQQAHRTMNAAMRAEWEYLNQFDPSPDG